MFDVWCLSACGLSKYPSIYCSTSSVSGRVDLLFKTLLNKLVLVVLEARRLVIIIINI